MLNLAYDALLRISNQDSQIITTPSSFKETLFASGCASTIYHYSVGLNTEFMTTLHCISPTPEVSFHQDSPLLKRTLISMKEIDSLYQTS